MTPEMNDLVKTLIAEGKDVGASFGYTANHDRFSPVNWQDWKFFTKTRDKQFGCCDYRSSALVADLINANDLDGVAARARAHFARIREEIAAGKRFRFPEVSYS